MNLKYVGLALALMSFSMTGNAAVSTTKATWDFGVSSSDTGSLTNNQLSGSKNGIDLTITAWASSLHGGNSYCLDDNGADRCVQRSDLKRYGNSGLGVVTGDELRTYGNRNGDPGSPNHSLDNNDQDYEMILLSFSQAVNISSIDTGWNYSISQNYRWRRNGGEASVLAYTGQSPLASLPFSRTETWKDITQRGWDELDSAASTNNNGDIPVSSDGVFSKHWLIGAANAVSREIGHFTSHLKIAGVTFMTNNSSSPNDGNNTPVNAPAGIAFLLAFGAWVVARRKS